MRDGYLIRRHDYLNHLKNVLSTSKSTYKSKHAYYQTIVDAPFTDPLVATYLGLGIVVLLLVDDKNEVINRIALSNTEHAAGAIRTSEKHFSEIKIPLDYDKNIISSAILNNTTTNTDDWKYLFAPSLSASSARFNQAGAGIACSYVEPISFGNQKAAIIFSFYKLPPDIERVTTFTRTYADLVQESLASSASVTVDS